MPVITIQIGRDSRGSGQTRATHQQKAALIQGVTDIVLSVLDYPPHATCVVIEEIDVEDVGVNGRANGHNRHWSLKPPPGEQAT